MAVKKTKIVKRKKVQKKMDIEGLLVEVQARFDVIQEKLDALLSKSVTLTRMVSTEHDPGFKTQATVTKKFSIPQDSGHRERKMYKAVCAECKSVCEVPFMPRSGRPVYCKACYTERRKEANFSDLPNREELVAEISKTLNINMADPPKRKTAKTKKVGTKVTTAKKPKAKRSKAKK